MRWLIEFAFRVMGILVYWGGHRVRSLLGLFLGIVWFDLLRIRRGVAVDNVRQAFPGMSGRDQVKLARASLIHLCTCLVEYGLFSQIKLSDKSSFFEIENYDIIQSALAKGKGVLLLTLHIGNGDLGTVGLSMAGLKVNLVSKVFRNQALNQVWFKFRSRFGTRFISPEKSSFDILRALKRNEIVIFVLDQFMGPPVGVKTKFFGRETGTAAGLAMMAGRSGAPVVPVYTIRLANGRHRIVFEPEIPFQDLDSDPIQVMTQVYTDKIETIVRKHPEQWMWIHRRWKEFSVR